MGEYKDFEQPTEKNNVSSAEFFECSNSSGTVILQNSIVNIAAFIASSDVSGGISIAANDNSFSLKTKGALISECSNMQFYEKIRPIAEQMQLRVIRTPQLLLYKGTQPQQPTKRGR